MNRSRLLAAVVLGAAVALVQPGSAQTLPYLLFERYVDALRVQTGIPGLSAAIIRSGRVEWDAGFGRQDVERNVAALPDTPYPVGGLTQIVSIVHLLGCAERRLIDSFSDPIAHWVPDFPVAGANLRHVSAHATDGRPGRYRYDLRRFAALTTVAQACGGEPFPAVIGREIIDRLGMTSTVPGTDLGQATSPTRGQFTPSRLARYGDVLARTAVPYRLADGAAIRSEFPVVGLDASTGLITTVRDLARFLGAVDAGVLLHPASVHLLSSPAQFDGPPLPTAYGWFSQIVDGERYVWQFGHHPDAFSSLVLRVPQKDFTLVLLANSDGLTAGLRPEQGDVTASPFVRIFQRLFL